MIAHRTNIYRCLVIFFSLATFTLNSALGAVMPEPGYPGVIETEEDGEIFVEDRKENYRIAIPAPYWRFKTPRQLREQRSQSLGGCAPGGGVPENLLLLIENKDAHGAGASLKRFEHGFRLRDNRDLRDYIARKENAVLDQMEGAGERTGSETIIQDGMAVYKAYYTFSEKGHDIHVIMASFLARPPGEDVIVFEMQAFALDRWYDLLKEDLRSLINNFNYTGAVADQFFDPNAPEEKLPFTGDGTSQPPPPFLKHLPWLFVAAAAGLTIYMVLKRKRDGSAA